VQTGPDRIGRYRVLGPLGQGAMGVVYRGRDEGLERDVALKVLREHTASEDARARFLREARAAARLQHPNIVTIYELGEHLGAPFMAMELLEGVDLQRAIEGGLRPNPRVTLPIVLQLLAGLDHAHDHGIVHRDVKPSNVFLPRGRPVKIMDFGVARLGAGATTAGMVVGTPNYMSPEQVRAQPVDGRSDLFSAGLILYELVTGEKAYRADTVVAVLYKIAHEEPNLGLLPPGPQWDRLRAVLVRALARDPDDRYPDASAMAAELSLALQDLGGSTDGAAASDRGLMRTAPRASEADRPSQRPRTVVPPPAPAPPAPHDPAAPRVATRHREISAQVPAPAPRRARSAVEVAAGSAAALALLLVGALGLQRLLSRQETQGPSPLAASPRPATTGTPSTVVATTTVAPAPTAVPPTPTTLAAAPLPPPVSPSSDPPDAGPSPTPPPFRAARPSPRPVDTETAPAEVPASGARLERANELYERGRYQVALAEARGVLRREPGNAEARSLVEDIEVDLVVEERLKQAREAMRRGDQEAALAQVRAGLAVRSTDARLLALFRQLTQ
jgi:eukaryotic-like serine/threonine-protein kinase